MSQNNRDKQNLMLPKNFSASQVNWVGIITATISLLGLLQADNFIAQYPKVVASIGIGIGVLTIALRYFDQQPVRLPFQSGEQSGDQGDDANGGY